LIGQKRKLEPKVYCSFDIIWDRWGLGCSGESIH